MHSDDLEASHDVVVIGGGAAGLNGALMLANRPDSIGERDYYRQILMYAVVVTLAGPLLVWAALVLPGW